MLLLLLLCVFDIELLEDVADRGLREVGDHLYQSEALILYLYTTHSIYLEIVVVV